MQFFKKKLCSDSLVLWSITCNCSITWEVFLQPDAETSRQEAGPVGECSSRDRAPSRTKKVPLLSIVPTDGSQILLLASVES